MSWWTKIQGVVKKHDGRQAKTYAAFAVTFARSTGVAIDELGLYRKDPEKYPDSVNELPAMLEKARKGRQR